MRWTAQGMLRWTDPSLTRAPGVDPGPMRTESVSQFLISCEQAIIIECIDLVSWGLSYQRPRGEQKQFMSAAVVWFLFLMDSRAFDTIAPGTLAPARSQMSCPKWPLLGGLAHAICAVAPVVIRRRQLRNGFILPRIARNELSNLLHKVLVRQTDVNIFRFVVLSC
jgi:hypothetical protein